MAEKAGDRLEGIASRPSSHPKNENNAIHSVNNGKDGVYLCMARFQLANDFNFKMSQGY
ncbi:hypothetical protein JOD45_000369 [Scopulibacillus daqui]|uniref:Uncharacterized protein n=1 Tax=Scopulibacillus daqui TaxID=1469162 RepID=A0ABS2PVV5_9BACL|nr:hypothetical protein [Scopulibacillus daqui]MBM7644178.1 hypothetical protein [Scopulibacillus daqui]